MYQNGENFLMNIGGNAILILKYLPLFMSRGIYELIYRFVFITEIAMKKLFLFRQFPALLQPAAAAEQMIHSLVIFSV